MRAFLSVLTILGGLSGAMAQTAISVDAVRGDLEAARYDALESSFSAAHRDALEERDYSALRHVFSILFVTAHRDRLAQLEAWQAAHPASPYAATALAWSHYYTAYQWRGDALASKTASEAMEAFAEELPRAEAQADLAMEQAGDFLPAMEAAIALARTNGERDEVLEIVGRALAIAPDRHVLELGRSALHLRWGGRLEDNLALCAEMADKVPHYDAELCTIEMVFENQLEGPLRTEALAALDGRDDAFLDDARLDADLNEWRDRDGAAEAATRLHRQSLGPEMLVRDYTEALMGIVNAFPSPTYEAEARVALRTVLRERLTDNPQSTSILSTLLGDAVSRLREDPASVDLDRAEADWQALLEFGALLPVTWDLGRKLDEAAQGPFNVEWRDRYFQNQIYYSNYDPMTLGVYLETLFLDYRTAKGDIRRPEAATVDLEALGAAVTCPMMRAERLYEAVCAYMPNDWGCMAHNYAQQILPDLRAVMNETDDCAREREASLEDLVYTPIAAAVFLGRE